MTISARVSHYLSNLSSSGSGIEPLILTLSLTAKVSYLRSLSEYSQALTSEIRALKDRGWINPDIAHILTSKNLESPRNKVLYDGLVWSMDKKKSVKDEKELYIDLEINE